MRNSLPTPASDFAPFSLGALEWKAAFTLREAEVAMLI